MKNNPNIEYAIYRGDKFEFMGNRKECVNYLGCKEQTFSVYLTNTYKSRIAKRKKHKNCIVVVKLDDEDEEQEDPINGF
jgi:hypothetical protein